MSNAILVEAAKSAGCTRHSLPQYKPDRVGTRAQMMVKEGLLFKSVTYHEARYFTSPAIRDAFASVQVVKKPKKPVPMSQRPGWQPSDPMHLTPQTKYTVIPTSRHSLMRTNTYSPY